MTPISGEYISRVVVDRLESSEEPDNIQPYARGRYLGAEHWSGLLEHPAPTDDCSGTCEMFRHIPIATGEMPPSQFIAAGALSSQIVNAGRFPSYRQLA